MSNVHQLPKRHVNPRYDGDKDSQIENAQVDALINLLASDKLSAYPLVHGTDVDAPANAHINSLIDIPTRNHSDLQTIGSNDHHTKTPWPAERFNHIAGQIGELNNKNNMTLWNYDDGFYDVYVDESKISSLTSTAVSAGKLHLASQLTTVADRPNDDDSYSGTGDNGLVINPNVTLYGVRGQISANSTGFSNAVLIEASSGKTLIDKDVSSKVAGDYVDFTQRLEAGKDYYVALNNSGSSWTWGRYSTPTYPYTSTDVDIVTGLSSGIESNSFAPAFTQVTAYGAVASGSATQNRKDLGFTPNRLVLSQDATVPINADIQYVVSDNSGNSVTVTQANIDSEISLAFADGNIQVSPQLTNGDGPPEINYFGVIFV